MPELPEVETVRRTLTPVLGKRIHSVWGSRYKLRGQSIPARALRRFAIGNAISTIDRLGKYLILGFKSSDDLLINHLGMTGRLRIVPAQTQRAPHTHLVLGLSGGAELRYSDPRRFGHLSLTTIANRDRHPPLEVLGIDAMSPMVDGDFIYTKAHNSSRMLKTFLLDQGVIAGLGNIYVSEALWTARIRPTVRANRLSRPRAHALANAVHHVLELALTRGGTSLRDFVAADGATGENVHYLRVYDRAGAGCQRSKCSGTIRRTVIQGRATFHCPSCQRR